jgi:hypothetical protein
MLIQGFANLDIKVGSSDHIGRAIERTECLLPLERWNPTRAVAVCVRPVFVLSFVGSGLATG